MAERTREDFYFLGRENTHNFIFFLGDFLRDPSIKHIFFFRREYTERILFRESTQNFGGEQGASDGDRAAI